MVTMSTRQIPSRWKQKSFGDRDKFLIRVTKTLHYGKYPKSDCTSLPVTELAAELFSKAKNRLSFDILDVEEAARLSRKASVSPCSLVIALLYLDRLKASNPKYLAKVPPSQLFLISLMVGSKFLQDDGQEDEVNTGEWASYAGLTVQDINQAEKEFLHAIDWEVFVSETQFWNRLEILEKLVSHRGAKDRGWFSYTDLNLLLGAYNYPAFLKHLINIILVCSASYLATVFAVLGSTMLVSQIPGLIPSTSSRSIQSPLRDCFVPVPPSQDSSNTTEEHMLSDLHDATISFNCPIYISNDTDKNELLIDSITDKVSTFSLWTDVNLRNLWLNLETADSFVTWRNMLGRFIMQDTVPGILLPTSAF